MNLLFLMAMSSNSYAPQYPTEFSDTTIKCNNEQASAHAFEAFNPAHSLIGAYYPNVQWISADNVITNSRINIDLGSAKTIKRIYYENAHNSGTFTNGGARNFTFWGSNTAGAFADTTYATDTNWTQLTISSSEFVQHPETNTTDPHYITVTNTTAYRYYSFKIADNWGRADWTGIRRIVLQGR